MFISLLKKDFKLFLLNKSNVAIMLGIPILLILVFGFTLENYMNGDYGTFDAGKVFYYNDNASLAALEEFDYIAGEIEAATDVTFEEITDYEKAQKDVEQSEGFAVIRISRDDFDYYRSPYNETEGGSIVRGLFSELVAGYGQMQDVTQQNYVAEVVLDVEKPNSKPYYTFAGLGLAILLSAYLCSGLFNKEYQLRTGDRISMTPAGITSMVLSKVVIAVFGGVIQIVVSLVAATVVFDIKWKHNFGLIFFVFLVLAFFSAGVGAFAGAVVDNLATAQILASLVAMMSGYLGGAITPVYLMEKTFLVKYLVKISPLYWTNKCLSNLYNDIVDDTTRNCLIVIITLSVILIVIAVVVSNARYRGKITVKPTGKEEVAA